MFLDAIPAEPLLRLAERLGVAVIVETDTGRFELCSRTEDQGFAKLFLVGGRHDSAAPRNSETD
jgi:hypothetical protein